MAVYGNQTAPFHEELPYAPIDPYGVAKAACEQDIKIAGEQHGLDWCIIRPHNVYGRNQNLWDSYRNFIGICIYKGLVGDPITVYGDGTQTRAFSEMTDSLEPLWNAGVSDKASKQVINLGGIVESSINDVANIVKDLSGSDIIYLPPRHEVKHAYSTWQKSVDLLGFEHKTNLEDGIVNMWEWAKKQPKRERYIWDKYEIEKGLYPYWKPEALKDGYFKRGD
jgi:UDP-glucose 4-epimerase